MITEMRDPNAIYTSLVVAVVTVIKGHNKTHYTTLGWKKETNDCPIIFLSSSTRVQTGLKISVIRPDLKCKQRFITQHHYQ